MVCLRPAPAELLQVATGGDGASRLSPLKGSCVRAGHCANYIESYMNTCISGGQKLGLDCGIEAEGCALWKTSGKVLPDLPRYLTTFSVCQAAN